MREGELHQWGYTKMDGFFHGLFEHRINKWMISGYPYDLGNLHTWWLIPLSKWIITPVINGISRVNPLITGVIT